MRKSRFTDAQIIAVPHGWEAGAKVLDLVRRHGVTEQTRYRWKKKYGGMLATEAKRLKAQSDSYPASATEPPRDYRRLHFVRTWSHGEIPSTSI